MPRTNTAAKKAARQRQRQTGEPYTLARRSSEVEPQDWIIQEEAVGHNGSLPYPWLISSDGKTFGYIDHGLMIGFVDDPESRTIHHYWSEVREDPTAMVGKWAVTKDRYTSTWSTWRSRIRSITPAPARSERSEFMGGSRPASSTRDGEVLAARALYEREPLLTGERSLQLTVSRDGAQKRWYDVSDDWSIRDPEENVSLGLVEEFLAPSGEPLDVETIQQDSVWLTGTTVRVRSSDSKVTDLGQVIEVWEV